MKNLKARITGTGTYLPEKVLTNADLEKMVDTSDEWIVSRTGMKERRIAGEAEYTSQMGVKAAQEAMKNAGVDAKEIDIILFATLTPDFIFPGVSCLVQKEIGAENAAAVDIQAACTGYIYGLSMAKAYIDSGMYKNVLLIAGEKLSTIVNYEDRNTCVLFGDGAAACVVSSEGKGLLIENAVLGADGEQAELLIQPAGGTRNPATKETVEAKQHCIHMSGRETFKHAVRRMESATKDSLEKAGLEQSAISWLVPHQANIRIIEATAKRFDVPMEKVYITIHKYGNTSASSVGIALHELMDEHKPKAGEHIVLTAFGAGLTWGSSVLTVTEK